MFCADYIAAFVFHAGLTFGISENILQIKSYTPKDTTTLELISKHSFVFGAISGLLGGLSVYPFDFVRQGVLAASKSKLKLIYNLSTVPYASVYFGLYFSQRNPQSLTSQTGWASASAFLAAVAELPFDKAKKAMMGSTRTVLFANALYVPFGAMMLIMYDKALGKVITQ